MRDLLGLTSDYKSIFETYTNVDIKHHVNKLKELDQFYPIDSTFFCITNTISQTFEFVSKNFTSIMGYEADKLYSDGMPFFWSLFHPNDLPLWLEGLKSLMDFTLKETSVQQRVHMSYTWNYKLKNKKGDYINVIQNTTPLEFDENNKPIIGLAHYSVLDGHVNMDICASAKALNSKNEYETIFFKNFSKQNLLSPLSNRERDISRLLILDKSSNEISEALNISKNTVDTHRRNILKKMRIKSTSALKIYFKENVNLI